MTNIPEVKSVEAYRFPSVGGDKVLIAATGVVNTSGWSDLRLSPRFYIDPPPDGVWEFDFTGDPPAGEVLQVMLPVSAFTIVGAPDWLKGVRVHGENSSAETTDLKSASKTRGIASTRSLTTARSTAIVQYPLATYDDSFQPTGFCSITSIRMKKLRHELTLTVEGPDEQKIRSCINEAAAVGLIAAIIAVYATGGGALSAAISAFLGQLGSCLGPGFTARVDDRSHWIEWCT